MSAQGRQMKIYAPTRETFVVYAGEPPRLFKPPEPDDRQIATLGAILLLGVILWWRGRP